MSAQMVLELALERGVMIATAESCTGGLISGALTEIPGSSAVFDRGFVTYTNAAKQQMLGVRSETFEVHGAVSEDVALEMAEGAIARSDAALAVSVTGIAGPGGGSPEKLEGRVCFGLARRGKQTVSETIEFGAVGRSNVRAKTVQHALSLLLRGLAD